MKLPQVESPLTGQHALTNTGFWVNGITWVVAL